MTCKLWHNSGTRGQAQLASRQAGASYTFMRMFVQRQHRPTRQAPAPVFRLACLCILWAIMAVTPSAGQTNVPAEPSYVDVLIHNAPEKTGNTNFVAATVYDIVAISSSPHRQGVVASGREFRLSSYRGYHDRSFTLPHAVQQPRERIFDQDSDDDDEFGFNIPGQNTSWETVSDEQWGWLRRDVNEYSENRTAMRDFSETALRESLMMQSLGLGNRTLGLNPLLPDANSLLVQPRDVQGDFINSRSLLDRELLKSTR